MLYITLFFESIIFPTIVALGMRGLGKYSKRGSGFLVAGVAGGAVVPPALGGAADASSTAHAMAVPLGFFVLAWSYCFAVNFIPAYRGPVDSLGNAQIGLENKTGSNKDEESASGHEADVKEKGGLVLAETTKSMDSTPEISHVGK
jgi:FHS family L-fucose permease-like MFS transporter